MRSSHAAKIMCDALAIGPECLCDYVFRFGFTPYDPVCVCLEVEVISLLILWTKASNIYPAVAALVSFNQLINSGIVHPTGVLIVPFLGAVTGTTRAR